MWPLYPLNIESGSCCDKGGETGTGSYFLFPSVHYMNAWRKSKLKSPLGEESRENCVIGSFLPYFSLVIVLMCLEENKKSNVVTHMLPLYALPTRMLV